jgi:hypothetical protein
MTKVTDIQRIPLETGPNPPWKLIYMCNGTEAGSHLRRIDSCITQFQAQGLSRTCNESKEEGGEVA